MASKKRYDLCVKVGTFEKDGQTKNRYLNIGVILESDKGMYMLLNKTFNPAGVIDDKQSVMVSMFSKEQGSPSETQQTINPEDIAWQE